MNKDDLEIIIEQYGQDIFNFCLYITQNRYLAEELYQDTFLLAYEKMEKISVSKNPKAYIMGVSVNIWKNRVRKESRRRKMDTEQTEYQLMLPSADLLDGVVEKETVSFLQTAVNNLAPRYKAVIVLHYVNSLSTEDISLLLKIPKGTVLSRLHKARSILKKELEKDGL